MKNFVQDGDVLDLLLSADVAAGGVVIAGDIVGIAITDGKSGATISVKTSGVFDLPYGVNAAVTLGAKVYWDGSKTTGTATGNTLMGHAVKAAAANDATLRVKLIAQA